MLYYVTSSNSKIKSAKRYLARYGVEIERKHLEMIEIQSHSGEEIIKHKAEQAFAFLKQPLVVSDHFWHIPALRGFPGAYMKYVNEWFTPQDFLNLIQPYKDRTIFLEEFLVYIDGTTEKLFHKQIKGMFLPEAKGKEASLWEVISLRKDGKSVAACWAQDLDTIDGGHPRIRINNLCSACLIILYTI